MSIQSISFPKVSTCQQPHSNFFKDVLHGDKAFYKQSDYLDATRRDFAQNKPLPVNYIWNTEDKTRRIAKQILSIIIFPIGIYQLLHALAGKVALLPASNSLIMALAYFFLNDFSESSVIYLIKNFANIVRSKVFLESEWKYKRITVEVDGYKIDAVIMGKESTLNNLRWTLVSIGNGELYEATLCEGHDLKCLLHQINSNAIVFNYPGVGASSGLPNRQAMAKAYRAMLTLLEDQQKGIGAKEIIGYGHSIGGGVQGDALKTHELKKDIKYVFVKSRTFSDLSTAASAITIRPLGFLVKMLGWNMGSVESSKKIQVPEIIMQTNFDKLKLGFNSKIFIQKAGSKYHIDLKKAQKLSCTSSSLDDLIKDDDGVIPASASLAKVLLKDKEWSPRENQIFIGIRESHNDPLIDPSFLTEQIEALLV